MLAYFPEIYPDELLYSVIARYVRHTGARKGTAALTALFGRRLVMASIDLPGHLHILAQRLPPGRGWDVDRLIEETTLLGYYTAFQSPAVRDQARAAVRAGKVHDLHLRLGVTAFRTARVSVLRFCPECLVHMRAQHGEAYWRRQHQLPGVQVCVEHRCLLLPSNVDLDTRARYEFVAATSATCPIIVRPVPPPAVSNLLWRVAKASAQVLTDPPLARSYADQAALYRTQVKAKGLALGGRVDQVALRHAFRLHLGKASAYLPANVQTFQSPVGWLPTLVRTRNKAMHPLLHVLLQDFLAERDSQPPVFGEGPWACPSPLTRHTSHSIHRVALHRNHGRLVGVFRCQCGYVYTRNVDLKSGELGPPRFQAFGPRLLPALRRWLGEGASLREITRRLQLHSRTVVHLAAQAGLDTGWAVSPRKRPPNRVAPKSGTAGSAAAPTTRVRPSVDWSAIDRDCVKRVQRTVASIRRQAPPVRITWLVVESRVKRRDWLKHRRTKLPLANAALTQAVESVEQFQRRRIDWAIRTLWQADEVPKAWRVMRKAGVRRHWLPYVLRELHAHGRRRSAAA